MGFEQPERIHMKKVMEGLQIQMNQRTRKPFGEGLYDKNPVKVINCRVILVAAYMTNLYNFTGEALDQPDKETEKILRENNTHGNQCSDEGLISERNLVEEE